MTEPKVSPRKRQIGKVYSKWRAPQNGQYHPRPFLATYVVLLVVGLLGAWLTYLTLRWIIPGAESNGLDTVKTAFGVVAGSGAGAALYVSYRKQRNDESNSVREQDRLFTERYTQAVSQLGNGAAAVRLGGVYALARIADDSERDRDTCLSLLCAYLRTPFDSEQKRQAPEEYNVRSAAQQVVFDRLVPVHPGYWARAAVDLRDAHLWDITLNNASVYRLRASRAIFHGDFVVRASEVLYVDFEDASFLQEAKFYGTSILNDALFRGATFTVGFSIYSCRFPKGFNFAHAKVGESESSIYKTVVGDGLDGNQYSAGSFYNATIDAIFDIFDSTVHGRFSFEKARFAKDVCLSGVRFNGAVSFTDATFASKFEIPDDDDGMPFESGIGPGVEFLSEIDFSNTDFAGTTLVKGAQFLGGAPKWPSGYKLGRDGNLRKRPPKAKVKRANSLT